VDGQGDRIELCNPQGVCKQTLPLDGKILMFDIDI
jgi:hypothetical protein